MLKRLVSGVFLVVSLAGLTACSGFSGPSLTGDEAVNGVGGGTPAALTQENRAVVSAEGVVEPVRWVDLRFLTSGSIAEVTVEEGDRVSVGQSLLRVDPTDGLLAVEQAQAGLSAAQAQLALARAGARPQQVAILEAQLSASQAGVEQAAAVLDERLAASGDAALSNAQANVILADVARRQAEDAHNDTLKCFDVTLPGGDKKRICPALGPYEEMARYQWQAASGALEAAQAQLDTVEGVRQADIEGAQAALLSAMHQRDAIREELDRAQSGSRPEEIAAAEAQVLQAEAAVAQAQQVVTDTVVKAPFDGFVISVDVKAGDEVVAGDLATTVATLDHLRVRTIDLSESDVVRVAPGQEALVWMDALPDVVLPGHLASIEQQSTDHWGDVTYAVLVELDQSLPPSWRWGMTAQVDIAPTGSHTPLEPPTPSDWVLQSSADMITGEGSVEPVRWSAVRLVVGGTISDVLVESGESVEKGDLLVRIDPAHAQLAVNQAQAALASAQAQVEVLKAGPQPDEQAAAEERVAAAQSEIARAAALRDKLAAGAAEAELAAAKAALESARLKHEQAQLSWQQADKGDDEDQKGWAHDQLIAAELAVAAAEERVAAQPAISAAHLRAARAGVQAATAQRDVAQAELDLLNVATRQEEIEAAEAGVQQAKAVLAAKQVALERTELRAPFDGVVTRVYAEVGGSAAPAQPMLVLATLGRLQVETTDLTEMDAVRVTPGDPVTITVDALPDLSLRGHVTRVKLRGVNDQGDVIYPVIVALDQNVPELMWGMTVLVGLDGRN